MKAHVLVLASIFFAPVEALAQPAAALPASDKLKILSWNIYMLPSFLGKGTASRAEAIGKLLASSDYDVIVFQEAFDGHSRRIISRLLQPAFSFQAGPANQKVLSLKTNSGIWIFSKYPIRNTASIIFKTRMGIDAFSRKGALLAEIEVRGQRIQIIGTHLQNAGGDWLRHSQCVELYNRLLKAHERIGVPQIVCGDFNIDRFRNEESYSYMLHILDAADGATSGSTRFSYDRLNNDLTSEADTRQDLIDYVLFRQSREYSLSAERRIRVFRHPWRKGVSDLSDHFAMEAEVDLPTVSSHVASAR